MLIGTCQSKPQRDTTSHKVDSLFWQEELDKITRAGESLEENGTLPPLLGGTQCHSKGWQFPRRLNTGQPHCWVYVCGAVLVYTLEPPEPEIKPKHL